LESIEIILAKVRQLEINLVVFFSKPERLKSKKQLWVSPERIVFGYGYRLQASALSEDFSAGPVGGSNFSLHTQPLGNPSPTQAQT